MENRELGLLEIFNRVKAERDSLGLVSFKRTPTRPSQINQCPCVFMLEGIDVIFKHADRDPLGYPARRVLDVSLELVVDKRETPDIKLMMHNLRKAVFKVIGSDPPEYSGRFADNLHIRENRMEGPIGYGLPDIKVMKFVLDLTYIDGGL
jgi:hypothetical protein